MKILLAIDHSPASRIAVREVASRPWPDGTTMEVLHAIEPPHAWTLSEEMEQQARMSQDLVRGAEQQLCAAGLTAVGNMIHGDPKSVIVDRAGLMGADFVILGSHGSGGLTQFLLGGVARGVVRFAPCSVEIVRGPGGNSPAEGAAVRGKKILLATDGSASAAEAARSVAARPWPDGTEVEIFTVLELALTDFQAAFEPPLLDSETKERIREDAMRHAEEAVQEAATILANSALKTSDSISVLIESPKQIILDEAKNFGADLIVTGSHGRRKLDRFLLGSVSEAVAAHAECSVEVIRSRTN